MIKILLGNTLNSCMNAVIDRIKENDYTKGRHVVIIPDAHTLTAEKVIFERLGINGSMNIEAVSFTRFARKVLGGNVGHTLSKQGAVLYFKKAINKVQDKLVHYKQTAKTDGFAGEMYAVIASVRNNGISENDLEEAILKLSGTTMEKAKDILVLYKEYIAMLKEFSDSTSRLEKFMQECPSSPKVTESYFYLYGFDSLSEKQIEIISTLAKYSKGVTIGLVHSGGMGNKGLYPDEVVDRLTEYLDRAQIDYEEEEGYHEVIKAPFDVLHDNLFSQVDARAVNDGSVTVFKEINVYEEYNAIAREIVRLVRREKLRYKDIAVIDCAERASVDFKEILNRYQVPHFMDERYNLTSSLLFRYVSALFDVIRYGYRIDKVRAFIKSPLFSLEADKISAFENYILAKNLSYNDYEQSFGEEEFENLRKELKKVTMPFVGNKKVVDFVIAIRKIIGSEDFKLKFDFALEGIGDLLATYNKQSLERFSAILDEYEKLIGDEEESPSSFMKILSASCEAEEIALIPRFLDAVYVGMLRESCITSQKVIFVANATDAFLPSEQGYQAIISALDMEKLEKGGVRLYPTPIDRLREERFAFIDLITKTQKLYIGYPEIAFDGTQNKPSQAIKDVLDIFSTEENKVKPQSLNEKFSLEGAKTEEDLLIKVEDAVGSPTNAFYTFLTHEGIKKGERPEVVDRVFATLKENERLLIVKDKVTPSNPNLIYTFRNDMHTSISQIERYFTCPYSHFLQYGLRINDRKEGILRVNDVGAFVHEVLERYFKKTKGKLRSISKEEMETYADEAVKEVFESEDLAYLRNDPNVNFLLDRLKRESKRTAFDLTANVLKGSFEPTYFELSFGSRPGQTNSVCLDTPYGKISFHGKIDRVDVATIGKEKVAIAIDYKTGAIDADLHNVYYGAKLQLYLYLIALREGLKLKPVGSFYLPIRSGYSSQGRNYRFQGQFSFTPEMIKALDEEKYTEAVTTAKSMTSDIIPISFSIKNGTADSRSKKNKIDDEGIASILKYVEKIIPIAIEEIGNGYIEKAPLGNKCEFCYHKEICGGAPEDEIREDRGVNTPLKVIYSDESGITKNVNDNGEVNGEE